MKINTICRFSLILAGFLFVISPLYGQYQNHLILRKNYHNRVHYLTGDSIRFSHGSPSHEVAGIIDGIGEDILFIADSSYHIRVIKSVTIHRTAFNYKAGGRTLQIAAPGFLAVAATNALIQNNRPVWTTGNLITAGVFFLSGTLFTTLQTKEFKLGNKYNLRIVPSDPSFQQQTGTKHE